MSSGIISLVSRKNLIENALAFGFVSQMCAVAALADEKMVDNEFIETDTGLKYKVIKEGNGAIPIPQNSVKAHYTGWLNGFGDDEGSVKFDSSYDRRKPFTFKAGAGQVIKGWDESVLNMKVGEKRQIIVPPELGYGKRGAGGVIPPNATLYFDIELLGIL
eukprot:CAMPEP_0171454768 /NCGR_PEP_ID=MMETSP0945-20130129/1928_1 /TAXON_ID=109269 /ORGANISM="Vaucheria litorea, Strain CCMP2940" /LENGTH=160 /DNA_ID=CAMNT_0011979869 /DNA_START=106 /DNA_END=588 /DNA_ORIENTATION=-